MSPPEIPSQGTTPGTYEETSHTINHYLPTLEDYLVLTCTACSINMLNVPHSYQF